LCCTIASGGLWIGIALGIVFDLFALAAFHRFAWWFDVRPMLAIGLLIGVSYFLLKGITYWRLGQPSRRLGQDYLLCTCGMIVSAIPVVAFL